AGPRTVSPATSRRGQWDSIDKPREPFIGCCKRLQSAGKGRAMTHGRGGSIVVVALAVGLLAACTSSNSPPSATGTSSGSTKPIVIGISLSQTGDFSDPGAAAMRGYELWRDTVNASGGILGRQVELKIADDASDPNQAVTNYE